MAVALCLGCSVCVPHYCRCRSLVDAQGLHGLVCKQAPSRIIRYHALNDVVARAIQSAGTPVTKEPVGLTRLDGKRPDGIILIPWQLLFCRLLLSLQARQQASLPVVKRRNIRAPPTRISFSQSQWNPTARSVPVLCPSLPLLANA